MTKSDAQKIIGILNEHTKRFDGIDGKLDRVIGKLLQHDVRFAKIEETLEATATKDDINMLQTGIDALALKTERLDQEFAILMSK